MKLWNYIADILRGFFDMEPEFMPPAPAPEPYRALVVSRDTYRNLEVGDNFHGGTVVNGFSTWHFDNSEKHRAVSKDDHDYVMVIRISPESEEVNALLRR